MALASTDQLDRHGRPATDGGGTSGPASLRTAGKTIWQRRLGCGNRYSAWARGVITTTRPSQKTHRRRPSIIPNLLVSPNLVPVTFFVCHLFCSANSRNFASESFLLAISSPSLNLGKVGYRKSAHEFYPIGVFPANPFLRPSPGTVVTFILT